MSREAGDIWMSPEYFRDEIMSNVSRCMERAEESLGKARSSLSRGDYLSSMLYSRDSSLKILRGDCGVGHALILGTRAPRKGTARVAGVCERILRGLGQDGLSELFFSVLDLRDIDGKRARSSLASLEDLLECSKPFFHQPGIEERLGERGSWIAKLFSDRGVEAYYRGGYYLDSVWYVRQKAEMLEYLLQLLNQEPSEKAFFLHSLPTLRERPDNIEDPYLECLDLGMVDQSHAEKKMGQAEKIVESVDAVLRPICEEMSKHPSGEMVFTRS